MSPLPDSYIAFTATILVKRAAWHEVPVAYKYETVGNTVDVDQM
jgi:hypothetical protein